jgi:hypothetical protein
MARTAEFSKPTKREALKRSGKKCEASGPRYGLPEGVRCNADLSYGVIYDHDDPEANSKDSSLENCRCICTKCNRFKTDKVDIPAIAKTVRQQDKANGIRTVSSPMPCGRHSKFKKKLDGSVVLR